jgi:hypothetical protein
MEGPGNSEIVSTTIGQVSDLPEATGHGHGSLDVSPTSSSSIHPKALHYTRVAFCPCIGRLRFMRLRALQTNFLR